MTAILDPSRLSHVARLHRRSDTFRWRLATGAVLIVSGYGAWLIILLVLGSNLTLGIKTTLAALAATATLGDPKSQVR